MSKKKAIEVLDSLIAERDIESLRKKLVEIRKIILNSKFDHIGLLNISSDGDVVNFRGDILISEIDQIMNSRTLERARYYLRRLKNSIEKIKTNKINDINLSKWKEYNEIITDSLWIFEKRDTSGAHLGWYWGNFIPQIPRQLMLRYTKKGNWFLDPFVGSGTTLIECRRL